MEDQHQLDQDAWLQLGMDEVQLGSRPDMYRYLLEAGQEAAEMGCERVAVYACGPNEMMNSCRSLCLALSRDTFNITSASTSTSTQSSGVTIPFDYHGKSFEL